MAGLSGIMSLVGTAVTAIGSIAQGNAAQAAANFQAKQYEAKGKSEFAAAQRDMLDVERQAKLLESKQIATDAAGGVGVLDQTGLDLAGQKAKEGAYRKLIAKYKGEDAKQGYDLEAEASRMSGRAAKQGAIFGAIGTIAGGLGRVFGDIGDYDLTGRVRALRDAAMPGF